MDVRENAMFVMNLFIEGNELHVYNLRILNEPLNICQCPFLLLGIGAKIQFPQLRHSPKADK